VRPELRFVAMSGLQQSERIRDLLQARELLFLAKPITTEKLLLTVREALERPANLAAA
jgi:DNA-binding NtrC family response regulator